jgi:predicted ATP-grasp superfamily ATP-dependent carboligase
LTPLVADFFADEDTQSLAAACCKLPGDIKRGIRWESLVRALDRLAEAAPSPVLGLVYGSGFEARPQLLARLAERWPLLGNDAATVARLKAPQTFFAELDRLGIPHPRMAIKRPCQDARWLTKRQGGAGGSHVVPSRLQKGGADFYYQERIAGRPVSALFVANGRQARVLGFSEQWTAPSPRSPFRYGGAVRPAALARAVQERMRASVKLAAEAFQIKGLASADFMVDEGEALLLEINPRPGATLDIYDSASGPLLLLHLDAVLKGELPAASRKSKVARASAIVYAPRTVYVPPGLVWPEWAADRPKPAERIDKYRPICTVLARATTRGQARHLVEMRLAKILANILSLGRGESSGQEDGRRRNASNGVAERQRTRRAARASPHR